METFTNYQVIVLVFMTLLNVVFCALTTFICYSVVRFTEFRIKLVEAIQDGDGIFHWKDAKAFGFFVAGYLCAWFTMNVAGTFMYASMFEVGPGMFLGTFIAITFTLWGIAWKGSSHLRHV